MNQTQLALADLIEKSHQTTNPEVGKCVRELLDDALSGQTRKILKDSKRLRVLVHTGSSSQELTLTETGPDLNQAIRELRKKELHTDEIARRLNLSKGAVLTREYRMRHPKMTFRS